MACVLTEEEFQAIQHLADRLESRGLKSESTTLKRLLSRGSERREVRASVAAETLCLTPQTIRNWVKRGSLKGRIDATGHVFVAADALKSAIDLDASVPHLPDSAPEVGIDEILAEIAAHRAERHDARLPRLTVKAGPTL